MFKSYTRVYEVHDFDFKLENYLHQFLQLVWLGNITLYKC